VEGGWRGLNKRAACKQLVLDKIKTRRAALKPSLDQSRLSLSRLGLLRTLEGKITTQMIPRNEKKKWLREKKAHGKANARALTGAEVAEHEVNKEERASAKALKEAQVIPQETQEMATQDEIVAAPKVQVTRTPTPSPSPPPPRSSRLKPDLPALSEAEGLHI
jgi:hypothetical protein